MSPADRSVPSGTAEPADDEAVAGAADTGPDLVGATPSGRRGRVAAVIAGSLGVVLILFVVLLATREPASDRQVASPLIGRPAPVIVGETVEGAEFSSDTYLGRWLVVNFFATWCGPCVREHPELITFQEFHRQEGDADVISLVFDDDPAQVREWFARNGGEWPVVDAGDRAVTEWGVSGVPESYLVDPGGTVVSKIVGGVTAEGLDRLLRQAQAARAAAQSAGVGQSEGGP